MFHVVAQYPSWAIPLFQIGLVVFLISGLVTIAWYTVDRLRGKRP